MQTRDLPLCPLEASSILRALASPSQWSQYRLTGVQVLPPLPVTTGAVSESLNHLPEPRPPHLCSGLTPVCPHRAVGEREMR